MDYMLDWPVLFQAAGVWNVATGLLYLRLRKWAGVRLGVGSNADPTDRQFANLFHIYFGVVAFWVAQDPARDLHLIALWMVAKSTSVVLALRRYRGQDPETRRLASLVPAATDVLWSLAFAACLWDLS